MKVVCVDTEYTGEHARTTLVSVGMVTLEGAGLYVTVNDYARDQVTDWLRDHVLSLIDERKALPTREACERIDRFLRDYSQGEPVALVSAGKATDLILIFQLWASRCPAGRTFHALYDLPNFLRHRWHMDLDTLFCVAGIDPAIDRDQFARANVEGARHHSLHDAKVVRACFLKLVKTGLLPNIEERFIPKCLNAYPQV
jgi:DNA polymerase III epsilon subunit-like protein